MRSPNFTVFIIVGFYLILFLFQKDGANLLGGGTAYLLVCALFLPVMLLIRKKWASALAFLVFTLLFVLTMSLILNANLDPTEAGRLIESPPFQLYTLLIVVLPGLFMVSELNAERLPHEFASWTGLRIFRPLISVFAARERILRRLDIIRETSTLRGIALETKLQHICQLHVWVVPLVSSAICEAAYAFRHREMIGSAHYFSPANPKKPILTALQKVLFIALVVLFLFGLTRIQSP